MALLVDPLRRRGLARPTTLNRSEFDAMISDMCAKLAYMTDLNLSALEEQAANNPGGKSKDRFPIANAILEWAADIQAPDGGPSPLVRAVFSHQVGADALAGGWGPELLRHLKRTRRWPGAYALSQVQADARDAVRRLERLEGLAVRGASMTPDEATWMERRRRALGVCRDIADQAGSAGQ